MALNVRDLDPEDTGAVAALLGELGYPSTTRARNRRRQPTSMARQRVLERNDRTNLAARGQFRWLFGPLDGDVVKVVAGQQPAEESVAALRHLEDAVTGITWAVGIALRYGAFYGPGTGIEAAPGAVMAELIRGRKFPIVGGGDGVWSLVHITDAASATVAAIERGKPGIYHVADDDPAPVREWLPVLARALGAKPPRRVPAWLVRVLAGRAPVDMMTRARGISSEKIKRELGWTPRYPSWRTGFATGLR